MSHSVTIFIIIIILLVQFDSICPSSLTMINPCEIPNLIELQSAIYRSTLIIRVPSAFLAESFDPSRPWHEVRVREMIKMPVESSFPLKINDLIRLHVDGPLMQLLDDSCWQYLHLSNVDLILFLNETTDPEEFQLLSPPVESTIRVRQNLDLVLNHETYSPQVIIKSRIDPPLFAGDYSLQCNARGNPLPRLFWSKHNGTIDYLPNNKQCLGKSCRIYSIQSKYQSILYFHSLTWTDTGVYHCHAENPISTTMTSVALRVEEREVILNQTITNRSCDILHFCHDHGQCVFVQEEWKCLCDLRYFGKECEINYDQIIAEQDNLILLLKSRFLAASLLVLISMILLFVLLISCSLARRHRRGRRKKSFSPSSHPKGKTKLNGSIPIRIEEEDEGITFDALAPAEIPLRYVYPRSVGKSE